MHKVYIKFAILQFFFFAILRFGWALILALIFLFLSTTSEFFFPLFVAFVAFNFIASVIETVKFMIRMKKAKQEFPLPHEKEEKDGEKIYYDAENPRSIRGKMWEMELKKTLTNESTVEECVAAFETMCADIKERMEERRAAGQPAWEEDDDLLFFECGTFHLTSDGFSISLSRQYPDGEGEFFQLCLEMVFEPNREN